MQEYRVDVASVKEGRLSAIQIRVIILCTLLGFADGYDTLAIAYAAPVMRTALDISAAVLGWIFSVALIGGIVGMLFGGPVADRIGRRPTLIAQVLLFAVFTVLSAWARNSEELLFYRFIAGLGLGLSITVAYALVTEYAPVRFKVSAVALVTIGYSTGAGLGGVLAAWLIKSYSWPMIFYAGGGAAFVLAAIFAVALPESLDFLVTAGKPRSRIDELARKIRPQLFEEDRRPLLFAEKIETSGFRARELFRPGRTGITLLLWVIFFMNLIELYSVQQWLPTLIHESGIDLSSAVSAGAALQTGAIIGAIIYSRVIDKWNQPFKLVTGLFVLGGLSFVSLAFAGTSTVWVMSSVVMLGMFVMGTQIALNGIATVVYPPAIRATGISWAVAVGRIGGAMGPIASGILLQQGFAVRQILLMGVIPASIAFLAGTWLALSVSPAQQELQQELKEVTS